ncbi:Lrp/AsnC family transcriptional regulator [Nocardia sp. NPDC052566]|uniref:Lrp/AsnC family transcriptional regulator n=1 Tax=Nocardia sp. NPDC052566 TaxID=3364330 RepID=UPI0037CC0C61
MRQLDTTERRICAALLARPRATWRELSQQLELSERTVVRRVAPLYADGTLRATVLRDPAYFTELRPMVLRLRCHPSRTRTIAESLARRPDSISVDVIGGGEEICALLFLDGIRARDELLLRDLPATSTVLASTAHRVLRGLPSAFDPTGSERNIVHGSPIGTISPTATLVGGDFTLIDALARNGRASYAELARQTGMTESTVRRRLDALFTAGALRPATELDLALLGVQAEAFVWITAAPAALDTVVETLGACPQVRMLLAITGNANLLAAVAVSDMPALYTFLGDTLGALAGVATAETTPVLMPLKRTGLPRRANRQAQPAPA